MNTDERNIRGKHDDLTQKIIDVFYDGSNELGRGFVELFRPDLIVNDAVLIELKACDLLAREHESQTLNYLRATRIEVALLMNFGTSARFKRLAMDNASKKSKEKSAESVSIGVKSLREAEVIV